MSTRRSTNPATSGPNLKPRLSVRPRPSLPPVSVFPDGPPAGARCRYGKSYESAAEVQKRFRIFSESLQLVRSTNRKGLSYRLGINRMTMIFSVLVPTCNVLISASRIDFFFLKVGFTYLCLICVAGVQASPT